MKNFLTIATLIASTSLVLAHSGATGDVKIRMDGMKSIAAAVKTLTGQANGTADFDTALVSGTADELARHAQQIPAVFRTKDMSHPSEATPEVWENWPDFIDLAAKLENAARMAGAAQTAAELTPAIAQIGQTCRACHETFRVKK